MAAPAICASWTAPRTNAVWAARAASRRNFLGWGTPPPGPRGIDFGCAAQAFAELVMQRCGQSIKE